MPFTKSQDVVQAQDGPEGMGAAPFSLEVAVCERAAQVMRGCAADLGLDHQWRERFDELAIGFEEDAVAVAALPSPEDPGAGPPTLRLVD
jgi:hypothetical protein